MMLMNQILKKRLADIFRSKKGILAAYLIGSYSKGKERSDSDFDLAVLVDDKKVLGDEKVYEYIRHLPFPKDLDLSVADRKSSPLFLFEIIRGERIYERNKEEMADFEAKVLHKYYDTGYLRKIYYSYLTDKFPRAHQ